MSAIAPAIVIPTPALTRIAPAIHIPAPSGLLERVRRAVHRERAETLEATVARSLEKAFQQFGRELAG